MRFSCAVTRRLRKNPGETIVSPGFFESFKRSSAAPSSRTIEIAAAEPTRMGEIRPEGIAASLREKSAAAVLVAAQAQRTVGTAAAAILIDRIPFTVEPFAFVRASAHGGDFAVHTGPFAAVTVAITIANAVASALTPVVTTTSHKIITPFVQN